MNRRSPAVITQLMASVHDIGGGVREELELPYPLPCSPVNYEWQVKEKWHTKKNIWKIKSLNSRKYCFADYHISTLALWKGTESMLPLKDQQSCFCANLKNNSITFFLDWALNLPTMTYNQWHKFSAIKSVSM